MASEEFRARIKRMFIEYATKYEWEIESVTADSITCIAYDMSMRTPDEYRVKLSVDVDLWTTGVG